MKKDFWSHSLFNSLSCLGMLHMAFIEKIEICNLSSFDECLNLILIQGRSIFLGVKGSQCLYSELLSIDPNICYSDL